ncbi:MAG: sodium/proton-translocating pyrophosphatase, partial [Candidatus Bathyarchaeia archaeon]
MFEAWLIAPLSALISILVGFYFYHYVNKQDSGTKQMQEIATAIQEGADAFLKREYTTLAIFVGVVAVLLCLFLPSPLWTATEPIRNVQLTLAYVFGSFCSALAGYLGLNVATKANLKAAKAAQEGLNKEFPIGFRGGAVMGLAVVGLGLLGI